VAADHQAVTPDDAYSESTGFGFTRAPGVARDGSDHTWRIFGRQVSVDQAIPAAVLSDATRDSVLDRRSFSFRTDVPPGTYDVTLWLGDVTRPLFQMRASVNGLDIDVDRLDVLITRGRLGETTLPDGRTPSIGNAVPRTVRVDASEGFIEVTVGPGPNTEAVYWDFVLDECPSFDEPQQRSEVIIPAYVGASLQALTLHPAANPPLVPVLDGEDRTLAISPDYVGADDPALAAAVDAFNSGDVERALELFLDLDDAEHPVAKAAGLFWVAGHPAIIDIEPQLLGQANALLQSAIAADSGDFAAQDLALQVALAADAEKYRRRYGYGGTPAVENLGRSNSVGEQFQPDHPYYWKGQILWLRNRGGLDPRRCTASWERAQWLAQSLDPKWGDVNPYVHLYATDEWENDGRPWSFVDWGALAGEGPEWARVLVGALNGWLDVFEWWAIHRQTDSGEMGGGWTDDVEIVPAFGLAAFVLEGASDISEHSTIKFTDGIWNSRTIDSQRGYQAQYGDVEHTAEPTGNSLHMYPLLRYGDPEGFERIMKSGKTFVDTFLTETPTGHLHFKGNHMSATRIAIDPNHRVDIPLNGRVVGPFPFLNWYSSNPGLEEPLRRWVQAWVEDAARDSKAKPVGVFPQAVWVPDDEIGYPGSRDWYSRNVTYGQYSAFPGYQFYLYNLAAHYYLRTGDERFRLPFDRLQDLAQAWLDAGRPPVRNVAAPPPGQEEVWAGGKLAASPAIADAVFEVAKATGSHDWDRFLDRFAKSYSRYARDPRSEVLLEDRMDEIAQLLVDTWPYRTTEGVMTDRILVPGWYSVISYYLGANVASVFYGLPQQAVTWSDTGRLFAAAVDDATSKSLGASLYLFSDTPRTVSLKPWALEIGGEYVLEAGPAPDLGQEATQIEQSVRFTLERRGQPVEFELPGRSVYRVRVRQVAPGGPSTPLLPDPAVAARDITYDDAAHDVVVRVHNIGAVEVASLALELHDGPSAEAPRIGAERIPLLEAPTDLVPRSLEVRFEFAPESLPREVTVVLDPEGQHAEVTEVNNVATAVIGGQAPQYPPPMILSMEPLRASPGERVAILGKHFRQGATALAWQAPTEWLTLTVLDSERALLEVSAQAPAGAYPTSVRNPDGQESNLMPLRIESSGPTGVVFVPLAVLSK
jgi:hypothetical protein